MNDFSSLTLIAVEAALMAGDLLRQGYGSDLSIRHKAGGTLNIVTQYDTLAEQKIVEFLGQQVPGSRFLGEEKGESGDAKAPILWIIDPLDGTVNFAYRIPVFAVSIAAQKKGQLVCGVIYQPITQELFIAEKGKGAFLNGKPIRVSQVSDLASSFLATGFPYNLIENPNHCIERQDQILRLGLSERHLGSAALNCAYTAAGRFDAFFEAKLSPWDVAAGQLILEEAGGKITEWDNRPYDLFSEKTVLASNGRIHEALSQVLSTS